MNVSRIAQEAEYYVFCGIKKSEYHADITILPVEEALDKMGEILKKTGE